MDQIRRQARDLGRDPDRLELLVWAFLDLQERPAGTGRPDFVGSLDEVRQDIQTARRMGVSELIFAPGYGTGQLEIETYSRMLEQLPGLIEGQPARLEAEYSR